MSDDIEQMRQMMMHMMARVSATEAISRAAFAMMCSFDGSPEMREKLVMGIFPAIMDEAQKRPWSEAPEALAAWLRTQEQQILHQEFEAILAEIEAVRSRSRRTTN